MSLLKLPAVPEWVWSSFHEAPERLRPPRAVAHVLDRWRRARALGASLEGPPPDEHLVRGEALREREQRMERLALVARPILERTHGWFAGRGYVTLLADADGVVVQTWAGAGFGDEAQRVRLIEGACWSEAARGTNAIGTALAEATPMAVSGNAHYGRRFHNLVCYAAPIHGPAGELLGVLDVTSTTDRADDGVALAIATAAESIGMALRLGAYASVGTAMLRTLGRSLERMQDPVLLVEAPGRIARMNAAARAALGVIDDRVSTERALGLSWEALKIEALAPGGRTIEVGSRAYRLLVDPVETHEQGLIALVLHLEPVVTAPRPSRVEPVKDPAPSEDPFARLFAEDDVLKQAAGWARRVARSDVPVMLLAETGSGKELFADAIHRASHRANGPFVAVNCGSIAPSLLESELFGHAPGAFTGADRRGRDGFFAAASGGTLFLDEVAETPAAMQVALLRVLEDGRYRRVGEVESRRADVRVVCATCRDLPAMVARGEFRNDLYFRLRGATISLPPLRARTDRVALARHLLAVLARGRGIDRPPSLSADLEAWIAAQPWPGNVRELKSVLEVALVMAGGAETIGIECLPPELSSSRPPIVQAAPRGNGRLEEVEAGALREVLVAVAGNISAAAARLGVARSTVYRLMRKHGLGTD